MNGFVLKALGALAILATVVMSGLGPASAVSVARADRGDDRPAASKQSENGRFERQNSDDDEDDDSDHESGGGIASRESSTDLVVKLKPKASIESLIRKIESWDQNGGNAGGRGQRYDIELVKQFPGTDIYLLHLVSGNATALARRLDGYKEVAWAEAGIFTPSTGSSAQFQQAAVEQFSQAAYEQFSQAAYEQFSQAAYEQFSQAVYEQFSQAAYEQFSQAVYEQFRQAAYEQFSQAAYEQFRQAAYEQFMLAAYEQFRQAAFEQFVLAAYEQFSQAAFEQFASAVLERFSQSFYDQLAAALFAEFMESVFEQFRQAVYESIEPADLEAFIAAVGEQFRQAVYEQFRQAVYESLDAVIATLNEDPDFRLLLQKLVLDFIEAIRAEQLARATSQFALDQINAAEAQSTATGRGVVVAVVDTGVYPTHWFLRDSVLPGIDLVDGDNDPTDVGNGHDDNGNGLVDEGVGHGTFIAGLIHLVAPDARILPIRVQNDEGDGWSFLVAEGIYRAVHAGANVVNLSLSVPATSEVLKSMVDYATQRGVVVVAAAGNDGEKVAMYPATYANVIGVAAVDSNNQKAVFSNYGNRGVDVAAPGVDLYGPYPVPGTTGMARWSGTSFSTALVSGEAALVFQVVSPRLTQSDPKAGGANVANVVMEKVLTTASSLRKSDPEFGTQMGRGLVNLQAAVAQ